MIRIKRIDHVAICVEDVDAAKSAWKKALGLEGSVREVVTSQKTDALLIPVGEGETALELIAPHRAEAADHEQRNDGLEKF